MVPGMPPVWSRCVAFMSGKRFGTRPYNAWYGVALLILSKAFPEKIASEMLGKTLVTKQSGADGLPCSKVHSALCTTQVEQAATALEGEDAIICCAQEHRFFDALAEAPKKQELDELLKANGCTVNASHSKSKKLSLLLAELK